MSIDSSMAKLNAEMIRSARKICNASMKAQMDNCKLTELQERLLLACTQYLTNEFAPILMTNKWGQCTEIEHSKTWKDLAAKIVAPDKATTISHEAFDAALARVEKRIEKAIVMDEVDS